MKKELILKHKGKTIVNPNEQEINDFLHESDEEILSNIKAGISFNFHTEETETQLIWTRH